MYQYIETYENTQINDHNIDVEQLQRTCRFSNQYLAISRYKHAQTRQIYKLKISTIYIYSIKYVEISISKYFNIQKHSSL
jgi:hypothetical protein